MAGKKGSGRKPTLTEPEPRACGWCGLVFTPIRKKWKQRFCSLQCQRASIGISPGERRGSGTDRTRLIGSIDSEEYKLWRAQKNAEIARATAWKRGNAQRGSGGGRAYRKFMGRHEHRVIAELMLGRKLLPGEVVHHLNGDRRDNRPENLAVLPSQAVHASIHRRERNRK